MLTRIGFRRHTSTPSNGSCLSELEPRRLRASGESGCTVGLAVPLSLLAVH